MANDVLVDAKSRHQDFKTRRYSNLKVSCFALLSIFLVIANLSSTPVRHEIDGAPQDVPIQQSMVTEQAPPRNISQEVTAASRPSRTESAPKAPETSTSCPQFPCDLSIVFVGDSLTRFMYISLVYYLRHNRWIDPADHPNLVKPKDFLGKREGKTNWLPFFTASNQALSPYESCDCWREPGKILSGAPFETSVENRYYHDPIRNNTVVFYQAFGNQIPIRGHWNDPNAILYNTSRRMVPWINKSDIPTFQFTHKDWADAIVEQVVPIQPHALILNAGLWKHNFGRKKFADKVVAATQQIPLVIWKTTTADNTGDFQRHLTTDKAMCDRLQCLNISGWTAELDKSYYVDKNHFVEPVYRKMNEMLLWDHIYPKHPTTALEKFGNSKKQLPWSVLNLSITS